MKDQLRQGVLVALDRILVYFHFRGGGGEGVELEVTRSTPMQVCRYGVTCLLFNSLTTEKQTTKFSSANFQKISNPNYTILRIQRLEGKQCRS